MLMGFVGAVVVAAGVGVGAAGRREDDELPPLDR